MHACLCHRRRAYIPGYARGDPGHSLTGSVLAYSRRFGRSNEAGKQTSTRDYGVLTQPSVILCVLHATGKLGYGGGGKKETYRKQAPTDIRQS